MKFRILKKLTTNNIKSFDIKEYKTIKNDDFIFNIPKILINFIKINRDQYQEKAGFLIGYKIKCANELTIKKLSLPVRRDKPTRSSFDISPNHKRKVNKYLRASKEKLIVLGIWHTHPQNCLDASLDDLELFWRLSRKSNLKFSLNTITGSKKTKIILYNNSKGSIENEFIF